MHLCPLRPFRAVDPTLSLFIVSIMVTLERIGEDWGVEDTNFAETASCIRLMLIAEIGLQAATDTPERGV